MELDRELSEMVLMVLARDLPYGVNLIGLDGTILASTDSARVGTRHAAARRALERREAVEVTTASGGDQPGINAPIEVDGQLVGVVGISGPVGEVRAMARLVAGTVALLMGQQRRLADAAREQQQRERVLDQIITHAGPWTPELVASATAIGVELPVRQSVVVFRTRADLGSIAWPAGAAPLVPAAPAVMCPERQLRQVVAAVLAVDAEGWALVAPASENLAGALRAATAGLDVVAALQLAPGLHHHDRVASLVALSAAARTNAVVSLAAHPDLVATLRALFAADGDLAACCAALHIHRNTLGYRLGRVHDLTGRDPRRLLDAVDLLAGVLRLLCADAREDLGAQP